MPAPTPAVAHHGATPASPGAPDSLLVADRPLPGGATARVRFTGRAEGDLATGNSPDVLAARRHRVAPGPWTWLRQAHGAGVVTVAAPGDAAGAEADAAVTATPGAVLAVHTADCAPVAVVAGRPGGGPGVVAVVHAGWRGLLAGVVEAAAEAVAAAGGEDPVAVLGPCIRPGAYEFGDDDLAAVRRRLGDGVVARTRDGLPALDLPAAVAASCARAGIALVHDAGVCTAVSARHWSHRARGEQQRQALAVWLDPPREQAP